LDALWKTARAADAALARGERRPLLGIPLTVKNPTTSRASPRNVGQSGAEGFFAPPRIAGDLPVRTQAASSRQDQTCRRLGRLAELQRHLRHHHNPYDLGRTPRRLVRRDHPRGRGGLWTALARSDWPARWCAGVSLRVYAHKPTFALVPSRGHTPPPLPPLPLDRDMAVIGPMARCALDLSLWLDVVAGPDPLEAGTAYKLAFAATAHGD